MTSPLTQLFSTMLVCKSRKMIGNSLSAVKEQFHCVVIDDFRQSFWILFPDSSDHFKNLPDVVRFIPSLHHPLLPLLFVHLRPGLKLGFHKFMPSVAWSYITPRAIGLQEQLVSWYPSHHLQVLLSLQTAPVHSNKKSEGKDGVPLFSRLRQMSELLL